MKFLNFLIHLILFIVWALVVFYVAKFFGFEYAPEEAGGLRSATRVVMILIILGGGYFIRKIEFFGKKKN